MKIIRFNPRFKTALLESIKCQTMRKIATNRYDIGDEVEIHIRDEGAIAIAKIVDITSWQVLSNCGMDKEQLAKDDGFANFTEMQIFLDKTYGVNLWSLTEFYAIKFDIIKILEQKQKSIF